MKTYVLMYHTALAGNVLDSLGKSGVDEWLQIWPGMVLFKGQENPTFYASKINEHDKIGMFIVTEYDATKSTGWMPPNVWEWIKPREPSWLAKTPDELAKELVER